MNQQASETQPTDILGIESRVLNLEQDFNAQKEIAFGMIRDGYTPTKVGSPRDVDIYFDHKLGDINGNLDEQETTKKYSLEEGEVRRATARVDRSIKGRVITSSKFKTEFVEILERMSDLREKHNALSGK